MALTFWGGSDGYGNGNYCIWVMKRLVTFLGLPGNIDEITRQLMFLYFRKTRSRETRGQSILEWFPTTPTYLNPINMNIGSVLCKVSWFPGFLVFQFLGLFLYPHFTGLGSHLEVLVEDLGNFHAQIFEDFKERQLHDIIRSKQIQEKVRRITPPHPVVGSNPVTCGYKKGSNRGPIGQQTEKPEIQETLHKIGRRLMFMGFW